jgi:hypothetical protein
MVLSECLQTLILLDLLLCYLAVLTEMSGFLLLSWTSGSFNANNRCLSVTLCVTFQNQ